MLIWKLPLLAKVQILVPTKLPHTLSPWWKRHSSWKQNHRHTFVLDAERQTGSAGIHTPASPHCAKDSPDAFAGDAEDELGYTADIHCARISWTILQPCQWSSSIPLAVCRVIPECEHRQKRCRSSQIATQPYPAATEEVITTVRWLSWSTKAVSKRWHSPTLTTSSGLMHHKHITNSEICSTPLKKSATRCLPCAVVIRQRISNARLSTQLSVYVTTLHDLEHCGQEASTLLQKLKVFASPSGWLVCTRATTAMAALLCHPTRHPFLGLRSAQNRCDILHELWCQSDPRPFPRSVAYLRFQTQR